MAVTLETLASYVPRLVRRGLAARGNCCEPTVERFGAAVLFADITGFTKLTERLARHGASGQEALTAALNAYFEPLIELIAGHGGDIAKMAGDALIALWPVAEGEQPSLEEAALRASQCGLAIQGDLSDYEVAEGLRLTCRVGVGAGVAWALQVGGALDRWELLLAGSPLVQMGVAQQQAKSGDVVLAPEAWELARGQCDGEPRDQGCYRLARVRNGLPPRPVEWPLPGPEAEPALRAYLPGAIRAKLAAAQAGWLAELRRLTVLFVNLPRLDHEGPGALARIQQVVEALQQALYRFEGSVNKISVDEKGISLLAALGLPPLAHEDDAARGVQAAQVMRGALADLGVDHAVGVATGRVYCGEVGSPRRREYTIIGGTVNLAARLMQEGTNALRADPSAAPGRGEILCDEKTYRDTKGRLEFEALPPRVLKNITEPVSVFRPRGLVRPGGGPRPTFGRPAERAILAASLDALLEGRGSLVVIEGDPGIGKSHLVADLAELAHDRDVACLRGGGDAIERSTPHHAWRPIISELLGVADVADAEDRRRRVHDCLKKENDADAIQLAPLLTPLLAMDLPETDLTCQMSGQVRADNTNDLLARLLQGAASKAPLALVVEDAHWFDSASWSLALWAARRVGPILLVVTTRPPGEPIPADYEELLRVPGARKLQLEALSADDVLALACQRLSVSVMPGPVADLIRRKAQGNPFYGEELAFALRDLGFILVEDGRCRIEPGIDLDAVVPPSLGAVIISRVDRLPPSQQLALKVASVIGRLFAFRVLHDIYPIDDDKPGLSRDLDTLSRSDLITPEGLDADPAYLFRHIITQEVVYDLMTRNQREERHRAVALWYEQAHGSDLSPYYPTLAYHWDRARDESKAIDYLEKAGDDALRRGAYKEGAVFLGDVIARADAAGVAPTRRARWELQLGEAHLALGRLTESREHATRALELLGKPLHRGARFWLDYLSQVLIQAMRRFGLLGEANEATREIYQQAASAYRLIGELCYFDQDVAQGVYAALRSASLAEAAGPSPELARSFAVMCIACSLAPLPSLARLYRRRALEVADRLDDLPSQTWVRQLIGMYDLGDGRWDESRELLSRGIDVNHRLGDWRHWEECSGELARLEYYRGEFVQGGERFRQFSEEARVRGHEQAVGWGLRGRAMNLLRLGKLDLAEALLEEADKLPLEASGAGDLILGSGLLAVVRLTRGDRDGAFTEAVATSRLIARSRPMVSYSLEGYAGAAEVFLALWEAGWGRDTAHDLARRAARACSALRGFARIFPVGRPRAWLGRGLLDWQGGRRLRAARSWRRALEEARRLAMPYEEALALAELARHADRDDPDRRDYFARAIALFERLGASTDLARLGGIE